MQKRPRPLLVNFAAKVVVAAAAAHGKGCNLKRSIKKERAAVTSAMRFSAAALLALGVGTARADHPPMWEFIQP